MSEPDARWGAEIVTPRPGPRPPSLPPTRGQATRRGLLRTVPVPPVAQLVGRPLHLGQFVEPLGAGFVPRQVEAGGLGPSPPIPGPPPPPHSPPPPPRCPRPPPRPPPSR